MDYAQTAILPFLGAVWRNNASREPVRLLLQIDPHSPGKFRVNGPFSNRPEFARAFDVADGSAIDPSTGGTRPDLVNSKLLARLSRSKGRRKTFFRPWREDRLGIALTPTLKCGATFFLSRWDDDHRDRYDDAIVIPVMMLSTDSMVVFLGSMSSATFLPRRSTIMRSTT